MSKPKLSPSDEELERPTAPDPVPEPSETDTSFKATLNLDALPTFGEAHASLSEPITFPDPHIPAEPVSLPDPEPEALTVIKPEKSFDGNQWKVVDHGGIVTVYLHTADGIDVNADTPTEEEGRAQLLRYVKFLRG